MDRLCAMGSLPTAQWDPRCGRPTRGQAYLNLSVSPSDHWSVQRVPIPHTKCCRDSYLPAPTQLLLHRLASLGGDSGSSPSQAGKSVPLQRQAASLRSWCNIRDSVLARWRRPSVSWAPMQCRPRAACLRYPGEPGGPRHCSDHDHSVCLSRAPESDLGAPPVDSLRGPYRSGTAVVPLVKTP